MTDSPHVCTPPAPADTEAHAVWSCPTCAEAWMRGTLNDEPAWIPGLPPLPKLILPEYLAAGVLAVGVLVPHLVDMIAAGGPTPAGLVGLAVAPLWFYIAAGNLRTSLRRGWSIGGQAALHYHARVQEFVRRRLADD